MARPHTPTHAYTEALLYHGCHVKANGVIQVHSSGYSKKEKAKTEIAPTSLLETSPGRFAHTETLFVAVTKGKTLSSAVVPWLPSL